MPDLTDRIESLVARYGGDEAGVLRAELRVLVSLAELSGRMVMTELVMARFAESAGDAAVLAKARLPGEGER